MEPVAAEAIMRAVISGALVVLTGACYALFLALAHYSKNKRYWIPAALSYAGLTAAVWVLAEALHLNGTWRYLLVTMLVGYLVLPQVIWALCAATHTHGDDEEFPDHRVNEHEVHL